MINAYLDELHESRHVLTIYYQFRSYNIRAAKVGDEYACAVFDDEEYLDSYSILIAKDDPVSPVGEDCLLEQLLKEMKGRLVGVERGRVGRP
jgi:hypothetical protein